MIGADGGAAVAVGVRRPQVLEQVGARQVVRLAERAAERAAVGRRRRRVRVRGGAARRRGGGGGAAEVLQLRAAVGVRAHLEQRHDVACGGGREG